MSIRDIYFRTNMHLFKIPLLVNSVMKSKSIWEQERVRARVLILGSRKPMFCWLCCFFRKREQEKNIVGACRSHCHHHHQKSFCMWLGAAANLVGVVSVCCELFRLRYTFFDFFWRSRTELGQRTNRTYVLCAILTRAVVTQNFATASSSFFVFVLLEGFCFF